MFNLTRPEKSLILLAPLARDAGGYGACRSLDTTGQSSEPVTVFADTRDADYQAILALCRVGKRHLESIKRFDMPGFRPLPQYIRELKRYSILPATFDAKTDTIDPYETDRRYWESAWHNAMTTD